MNSRSGHSSMIKLQIYKITKKVIDYQVKVKAGCRMGDLTKKVIVIN